MTQAPDDELAITAADTLREFDPAMVAAAMTVGMEARLLEVARRTPGLSAGAIHRFLDALPPMRNTTTEQIIQAVEQHPERWRSVTRESALSLPVPILSEERIGLAFFWYPVGGPLQKRVVRAPTQCVLADVHQSGDITFVPVGPTGLGFAAAPGQPRKHRGRRVPPEAGPRRLLRDHGTLRTHNDFPECPDESDRDSRL